MRCQRKAIQLRTKMPQETTGHQQALMEEQIQTGEKMRDPTLTMMRDPTSTMD